MSHPLGTCTIDRGRHRSVPFGGSSPSLLESEARSRESRRRLYIPAYQTSKSPTLSSAFAKGLHGIAGPDPPSALGPSEVGSGGLPLLVDPCIIYRPNLFQWLCFSPRRAVRCPATVCKVVSVYV